METLASRRKLWIIFFVIFLWTVFLFGFVRKSTIQPQPEKAVPLDEKSMKVINDLRDSIKKNIGPTVPLVGINRAKLEDLQLETGGNPIRSLIVTSWGSGSTFLGEVLNSINRTFYFDEPLMHYGVRRLNAKDSNKEREEVRSHIRKLLGCSFSDMGDYLNHAKKYPFQFEHNYNLWSGCNSINQCFSPSFLEPYCRQFPFISMKVIRSNLELLQEILEEEKLNVRILLLVRDPRPTLNSRWREVFCTSDDFNPCGDPKQLCAQLVSDFHAAEKLSKNHPNKFMTMRYEDLALNPYVEVGKVLSFFGLAFTKETMKFLDTYTAKDSGDAFSTFRKTSETQQKWINELSWEGVSNIQLTGECTEAMKLWGYKMANSEAELKNITFNPLV